MGANGHPTTMIGQPRPNQWTAWLFCFHSHDSQSRSSLSATLQKRWFVVSILAIVLIAVLLSTKWQQDDTIAKTNTSIVVKNDCRGDVCSTPAQRPTARPTTRPTSSTTRATNKQPLSQQQQTPESVNLGTPNLYIEISNTGGLGNKLTAAVGLLALARASGRRQVTGNRSGIIALYGSSIIWRDFWNESTDNDGQGTGRLIYATPPSGDMEYRSLVHCHLDQLKKPQSECWRIFWQQPDRPMVIGTQGTNHGTPLAAQTFTDPPFSEMYRNALLQRQDAHNGTSWPQSQLLTLFLGENEKTRTKEVDQSLIFSLEMHSILNQPTLAFQDFIDDFVRQHNLMTLDGHDQIDHSNEDGVYYFDIALHVRLCVDCGWLMTKEQIQNNIKCAFAEYQRQEENRKMNNHDSKDFSWNGTRIFFTSDDRNVLPWVQDVLPSPSVQLIHNMHESFIHTDRIAASAQNFRTLANPYLDHFLLSKARYVGTCWTSFARSAALRFKNPTAQHLDHILRWSHHPGSWVHNASCLTLTQEIL